jgi:hypothetical protein
MGKILIGVKQCNVCSQVKQLSEFVKNKNFKDGYRPLCKECQSKKLKEFKKNWAEERSKMLYFPKEKQCKDCLKIKPIDKFSNDINHKSGKNHICKECVAIRHKKYLERWITQRTKQPEKKLCIKCNQILLSSEFTKSINSKDGLENLCKSCQKQRVLEYKTRWKKERLEKHFSIKEKRCPSCNQILPVSKFYESDSRKDGLSFYCKECELQKTKQFVEKWEQDRSNKKTILEKKECNLCHRVLPILKFYKNRRFKNGINATCIECEKNRQKNYIYKWKVKYYEVNKDLIEKECVGCHRILPISYFNKNKRHKDGLTSACKDCEKKRLDIYIQKWESERYKKKDDLFTLFPTFEKKCNMCKRTLSTSQFYPIARSKDGLSSNCKECERKIAKDARKKYLLSGKWKERLKNIPNEKECRRCHQTLPASQFHRRKESSDGLALYCIKCVSFKNKEFRNNPKNHEKLLKYYKEYNHRPEVREHNRKWAWKYAKRPYVKKKRKAYLKEYSSRPEIQKRRKIYLKEYNSRPEVRQRRRQYYKIYTSKEKKL